MTLGTAAVTAQTLTKLLPGNRTERYQYNKLRISVCLYSIRWRDIMPIWTRSHRNEQNMFIKNKRCQSIIFLSGTSKRARAWLYFRLFLLAIFFCVSGNFEKRIFGRF